MTDVLRTEEGEKLANKVLDQCHEISRLRAALEKYSNEDNWLRVYDVVDWGCRSIPAGFKFDDYDIPNIEDHPWLLAQEALKNDS